MRGIESHEPRRNLLNHARFVAQSPQQSHMLSSASFPIQRSQSADFLGPVDAVVHILNCHHHMTRPTTIQQTPASHKITLLPPPPDP